LVELLGSAAADGGGGEHDDDDQADYANRREGTGDSAGVLEESAGEGISTELDDRDGKMGRKMPEPKIPCLRSLTGRETV
jgi:hypothetical protein